MISAIIFDLSEVLISGLAGSENILAQSLGIAQGEIRNKLCSPRFKEFLEGKISEDQYLSEIINTTGWKISQTDLKSVIRQNFHTVTDRTISLLPALAQDYSLYLLSDHGKEWIEYIRKQYDFFHLFRSEFYSFSLGITKSNPEMFHKVLQLTGLIPEHTLFIDDNPNNCRNAELSGIRSVQFHSTTQLITALRNDFGISVNQPTH